MKITVNYNSTEMQALMIEDARRKHNCLDHGRATSGITVDVLGQWIEGFVELETDVVPEKEHVEERE